MGCLSSWSCLSVVTSVSSCCLPFLSWRSISGGTGQSDSMEPGLLQQDKGNSFLFKSNSSPLPQVQGGSICVLGRRMEEKMKKGIKTHKYSLKKFPGISFMTLLFVLPWPEFSHKPQAKGRICGLWIPDDGQIFTHTVYCWQNNPVKLDIQGMRYWCLNTLHRMCNCQP